MTEAPMTITDRGHVYELVWETSNPEDAQEYAFRQRMAGAYIRVKFTDGRYCIYGRPGRPLYRPKP
jgi:hypothetical protein